MFTVFKKILLANFLVLTLLVTGAAPGNQIALAQSQNPEAPETPLYPDLTWVSLGTSNRDIRINLQGDTISVRGEGFAAAEEFATNPAQDVLKYYSNGQLAQSGWVSYDVVEGPDGVRYVFYHEAGAYLSVEELRCLDAPSKICLTVWKSEPVKAEALAPAITSEPGMTATAGTFGKTSPANGTTNLNPASVTLSWEAYSPTPEKYSYCVKEGSACANNDPNWTSAFTRSVTLTNLAYDKTYYWQVRAVTCGTCVPKTFVYANNGTWWTFKTKVNQVAILGNAGIAGAVLSYIDGTAKTVTADATGAYSISLPYGWSGTITPSKPGYVFTPRSASFSNLTAAQTIQNFTAIVAYTITGNVGAPGVALSYTDGTVQAVLSDSLGNYSISVPTGWSGTVTPSLAGLTFTPPNRSYVNVTSNQIGQNYSAYVAVSGNAGVSGVTLSYTDGTPKTVTADGSGNYSITVPYGWSGTVTPSLASDAFCPASQAYSNLLSARSGQNFAHAACPNFGAISRWTTSFDLSHGWTVANYVRTVGDVSGDGKADLVGFGLDGVYVAASTGSGFGSVSKWTTAFDLSHGWTVSDYVRTVGDVSGDGKDDLVGFGSDGVYVALSNGGAFGAISKWTSAFDLSHGWTVSQYVRTVGDVNGDGKADLVGFGQDGVYVATSTGSAFNAIGKWTSAFDLSHGWTVAQYVRTVGDVNGDGKADLVGFGQDGVYVATSTGSAFNAISKWTSAFDLSHGWTVSQYVRTVGDVNGDGKADLIGFGQDGVYIALSMGNTFSLSSRRTTSFDLSHGWTVTDFVRIVGDVNGGGKADLVGFGLDGVYIGPAQ